MGKLLAGGQIPVNGFSVWKPAGNAITLHLIKSAD